MTAIHRMLPRIYRQTNNVELSVPVGMQGRVSMSWEMIPAMRHLFLVLCNPLHSVTCYEVGVGDGTAENLICRCGIKTLHELQGNWSPRIYLSFCAAFKSLACQCSSAYTTPAYSGRHHLPSP